MGKQINYGKLFAVIVAAGLVVSAAVFAANYYIQERERKEFLNSLGVRVTTRDVVACRSEEAYHELYRGDPLDFERWQQLGCVLILQDSRLLLIQRSFSDMPAHVKESIDGVTFRDLWIPDDALKKL